MQVIWRTLLKKKQQKGGKEIERGLYETKKLIEVVFLSVLCQSFLLYVPCRLLPHQTQLGIS